ncbi:MAG: hypothetical protein PHG67_09765 [Bacteroidales bacterium]|nr:hypothetical protein [Bacteroidales bacterium]
MSFKDYYSKLDQIQSEIRDEIVAELDISTKTFYNRMNKDSWTKLERAAIDRIIQNHISKLTSKTLQHV